jgi:DNA transformation protein and related proteins
MTTKLSNSLSGARNIGATIRKRLNEIGVFTLADLAQMTPVKAYRNICQRHPDKTFPVCYYLYSLQGALLDLHWNDLPVKLKAELRKQIGK